MINYGQTNPMAKALAIMYCISFGGHIIVVHYLVSTFEPHPIIMKPLKGGLSMMDRGDVAAN